MRMDRMTSRLQAALADAQSLAVGKDHNFVQPVHLLTVLLEDKAERRSPTVSASRRSRR